MLSLEQACAQIFAGITPAKQQEAVALMDAAGRFVALPLTARVNNPAFTNSAMDGYAICYQDLAAAKDFVLQGESSCGAPPSRLQPGTAMRIFTGAPLPAGADTVVIQENAQLQQGRVSFSTQPELGDNVRYEGEDFRQGQVLYEAGHRLTAMDISLLAANGYTEIPVYARPRVLVVATGNELVEAGQTLQTGQIYESNKTSTMALLHQWGAQVFDGGIVSDNEASLRQVLCGSQDFDFIITSGGASVGDHDLVKRVFQEIGTIDFWRIRIKPGKPVAFGHLGEGCHFFALPGNPVSSLVTFLMIVVPALQVWNHARPQQLELKARVANSLRRKAGRMEFLRAHLQVVDGELLAEVLAGQGSHMVGPLAKTNGLIRVSEDSSGFAQGDFVRVLPLSLAIDSS